MAQTPTTKSQVQAYRFVLKRMESALVRKDAVMLHDPMKTHIRSVLVGIVVAIIGCVGFFIYGLFSKDPVLEGDGVYASKSSGTYYVWASEEELLIPVTNLSSARLILLQLGSGEAASASVKRLDDKAFQGVTRAPISGLPDGPLDIPGEDQLIDPKWSLCDTAEIDERLPTGDQVEQAKITTTAVMGYGRVGKPLAEDQMLLVSARGAEDEHYLIFAGQRARVDLELNDAAVARAFELRSADIRPVSMELINSIPEGPEIAAPAIDGAGEPSPAMEGRNIGDVLAEELPGQEEDEYHVVLRDGSQKVSKAVAHLIRYTAGQDANIPAVAPAELTPVTELNTGDAGALDFDVDDFPPDVARPMRVADSRVACMFWTMKRSDQGIEYPITITVSDNLMVPEHVEEYAEKPEERPMPTELAMATHDGFGLDEVLIPASGGAAVRGMLPDGQKQDTGVMWLVTDRGVRYAIPDTPNFTAVEIAAGIGLPARFTSGPEAIISILPKGSDLDPAVAYVKRDRFDLNNDDTAELPTPETREEEQDEEDEDGGLFGFGGTGGPKGNR